MRYLVAAAVLLSVSAAIAVEDEAGSAAPWLKYKHSGSRAYAEISVELFQSNEARVVVVKHAHAPRIESVTELTPAEAAWFRTMVRTTNFSDPDQLEHEAVGGHSGITEIHTCIDGDRLRVKSGRGIHFNKLSRLVFRLVEQAELLHRLQHENHAYDIRSALTSRSVLQPTAFVGPLERYIQQNHDQLDHALIALALITTPEEWGGILAQALEQANDKPSRERASLSRRQLLLNVITNHPFYFDLPDSHQDALIQVYRLQSAIEAAKEGEDAARHVRMFKEIEARLEARRKEKHGNDS